MVYTLIYKWEVTLGRTYRLNNSILSLFRISLPKIYNKTYHYVAPWCLPFGVCPWSINSLWSSPIYFVKFTFSFTFVYFSFNFLSFFVQFVYQNFIFVHPILMNYPFHSFFDSSYLLFFVFLLCMIHVKIDDLIVRCFPVGLW